MTGSRGATPIRRKLITFVLVTSGVALSLTASGLFVSEWVTFRQMTSRQLETLAKVVATNSTAALAFSDAQSAAETLKALRADPHVLAAVLYDERGAPFATYPDEPAADTLPSVEELRAQQGVQFARGRLAGFVPVIEDDQRMGTLFVRYDMEVLHQRMALYGALAALLIAFSCLAAYFVSRRLQLQISGPILSLAEVAKAISERRDYSVRAAKPDGYEVGLLTDAFNHMLGRVQEQLKRLNLLQQITRSIGERHDLPSIFQVVLKSLEEHMPIDFAAMCRYDAESEALTVVTVSARGQAQLVTELGLEEQTRLPIDHNGLGTCVRGQLVYEPDVRKVQFAFPQRLARGGLRSLVVAPMQVESRVFGALIAASRREDAFQSADCEFLQHLSAQVGLASNQAQLYGSLQQAYDDLRQTQQTVVQQERLRALGQMASGIAHDINNAISPVSLYTQFLLEREPTLSDRARDCLKTIQQAVDDVAATVSRMREFYRARETQMILGKVDLNRLVRQVLDLTRVRWKDVPQEHGAVIELQTELAEELPAIMGADSEIRDALTNLVLNAVDAMPGGGTLQVRTRAQESNSGEVLVCVEVGDTGVGMDEETQRRCLEPFFTTKGERGTGLGLAGVYGMVQRHSAEIAIQSAVGQGTTVRLIFPAVRDDLGATVQRRTLQIPTRRLRILLVDDDPLVAESLRLTLEADGHVIEYADGGREGIDAFLKARASDKPFDVIVTDLGMPHVDGRKVAEAINAASPDTPIIMLTGWGQRMQSENEVPPHVSRVLSKPPKIQELRAALADLADESAPLSKRA
jgi:signal transduction histidine kinase/ActR/RegA family two-component response regulator/uncharacterized membrane protein affecting hemolysin expression